MRIFYNIEIETYQNFIVITINVPVVFMARYVMVLRVQHHYEGHWKGWALKITTFLGPEMARAKRVSFGPKKKYKRHKNNWYIGSFMYHEYCCVVLLCVFVCCCV